MNLRECIRDVPDFPRPGIIFKDITTLLKDKNALKHVIDTLADRYRDQTIDQIVAIESRGFIFGSALAYKLGIGFVPVRKPNKLPALKERVEYALEYGTDCIEIHSDALQAGQNALIIDDLLATGGTASAAAALVERLGARVAGFGFIIELTFLKGRDRLNGYDVHSLIQY